MNEVLIQILEILFITEVNFKHISDLRIQGGIELSEENIYRERHNMFLKMCDEIDKEPNLDPDTSRHLYVDDIHRILYCAVPKVINLL